jgi:uncharacterized cofD-like protein
VRAIRQLSGVLVTVGRLYPSTVVPVTLCAEDFDGTRYVGETSVNSCKPPVSRIWLEPMDAEPLPEALLAIIQADLILLAPGSLYTSTTANLLIQELRMAISRTEAPVVYVANLMTEPGESSGLDLETHIATLQAFGSFPIHAVLANSAPLSEPILRRYADEGGTPLHSEQKTLCGVPVFSQPMLDPEAQLARHHPTLLNQALREVIESL